MFNYIEKLRKKSKSYRRKFAFIVSVLIVSIIFFIWLSILGVRLSNEHKIVSEEKKNGLFVEVQKSFYEMFVAGNEQFKDIKEKLEYIFQK